MNIKWWLVQLAIIGIAVAVLIWLSRPEPHQPPPDFVDQGFKSVHVEFRSKGEKTASIKASSTDPTVVEALAKVIRDGKAADRCRCSPLGTLEFRRTNGTAERLTLMPPHDQKSIEFRITGRGRYLLDRARFLEAVAPLGVSVDEWSAKGDATMR